MSDPAHAELYTPAEVGRLVGLHHSRVRRWLATSPSLSADRALVQRAGGAPGSRATFLDLVELFVAAQLQQKYGFSTKALRVALHEASQRLGVDHPLARRAFLVEDRRLHLRMPDGPPIELGTGGQLGITEVIHEIADAVEFDPAGLARQWWPQGKGVPVVLNPGLRSGAPVIAGTGVTTAAVADLWEAEGRSVARVARALRLEEAQVESAVNFEGRLAIAA